MRLIPLGTSACVANPDNACSGHLIVDDGTTILLDCGPGVVGQLRRHTDIRELTGIVITHMHQDHFLDLISLRCGLVYIAPITNTPPVRIPLFLPPGGTDVLVHAIEGVLMSAAEWAGRDGDEVLAEVFDIAEYRAGGPFEIGAVSVVATEVVHDVPAWALTLEGTTRFAYSGDTGPCEGIRETAAGARVFLCEAGAPDGAGVDEALAGTRAHLTAAEAAEIARDAAAAQLLLTHLWHEYDGERRVKEAQRIFGPAVELAVPHRAYTL